MKKLLVFFITLYQIIFSPDTGVFRRGASVCAFYPTCSEYSKQAIQKYGVLRGSFLTGKRILRCHPWQKNHIDYLQ